MLDNINIYINNNVYVYINNVVKTYGIVYVIGVPVAKREKYTLSKFRHNNSFVFYLQVNRYRVGKMKQRDEMLL